MAVELGFVTGSETTQICVAPTLLATEVKDRKFAGHEILDGPLKLLCEVFGLRLADLKPLEQPAATIINIKLMNEIRMRLSNLPIVFRILFMQLFIIRIRKVLKKIASSEMNFF